MKIKVLFLFVLLFLLTFVFSVEPYSVIGSNGISFSDSSLDSDYNAMCQDNPSTCQDGLIDLDSLISVFDNNLSKGVFEKNNDVRSFISGGADLSKDIEIDSSGKVVSGSIDFKDKTGDISSFVGSGTDKVSVKNVLFEKDGDRSVFNIDKDGSVLNINGNVFQNIVPSNGSSIVLGEDGNIESADFFVDKNGGSYTFGNTQIYAPADSQVIYRDGVVTMNVPKGSSISKMPSLKSGLSGNEKVMIVGKDVSLPNGHTLDDGVLNYKNGKFFVDGNVPATIDNIKIDPLGKYEVYFENQRVPFYNGYEYKKSPSSYDESKLRRLDTDSYGYVSIGSDSVVYSNVPSDDFRKVKVTFEEGAFFDNDVSISLNKDSYIKIDKKGWVEELPQINCQDSSFSLETGGLTFNQESLVTEEGLRKLSYRYDNSDVMAARMTIVSKDKIISVDESSRFSVNYFKSDIDEPLSSDTSRKVFSARSEIESIPNGGELVHVFYQDSKALSVSDDYSDYLRGAQEILSYELEKVNPDLYSEVRSMTLVDQNNFFRENGQNIALSASQVNDILRDTPYKDYYKVLDSYRDFHVFYETRGAGENNTALSGEAFGLRQAFYRYPE